MKKTKLRSVPTVSTPNQTESLDYSVLKKINDRAFFMALKMIDIANSRPVSDKGEPKVGGHASACASSQHILTAIHLVLKNPEDYMACKPHVSPMDHALNFLLHNFRHPDGTWFTTEEREKAMHHLRHYSHAGEPVFQSYHAEADPDAHRFFPSGSVGIPPVAALYTALGYEFMKDHAFDVNEDPYFWCLMGDSEFREGSLMEAMPDAGERELGKVIWIVDYNRQNLDGTRISNEKALKGSDADRMVRLAEANGWETFKLKHGKKREKLFATEGGEEFKRVLDEEFTDFEYQSIMAANNPELTRKVLLEKSSKLKDFLKRHSEKEIHEAYLNLAGHDLESLVEVLTQAKQNTKRPSLIVAYTIKGYGLRCQAMSGNHSTLPDDDELVEIAQGLSVDNENPFTDFAAKTSEEKFLVERRDAYLSGVEKITAAADERRTAYTEAANKMAFPVDFDITALKFNPVAHTQWMWGQVAAKIDRLARGQTQEGVPEDAKKNANDRAWKDVAKFFLTMAPDVGSSTNTSPNMNGKLYGDVEQEDFETTYGVKDEKAPDVVPNISQRTGHLRFEIAEGNCMSAAGAFGKLRHFTGVPLYPSMTIYDFFIKRALDQFYYNVYWHSHFATIGTPSGVTLSSEGAQHSWKSDIQMPHCITWEPCFAKELEWILADGLRRHFTGDDEEREAMLVRCVTKGLVQKEFLDRLKKQKCFESVADAEIWETTRLNTLAGGYALVDYQGFEDYSPGDNVIHLFAMGALGPEAVKASDMLREKGIFANVFIVTSPDLLLGNFAEHDQYAHLKKLGLTSELYLRNAKASGGSIQTKADFLALRGSRISVVSVHDGEPGLLDNIGSIVGVRQKTLAIRKTSKSGTTKDIYHLHGIDPDAIAKACEEMLAETAEETFSIDPNLLTTRPERSEGSH